MIILLLIIVPIGGCLGSGELSSDAQATSTETTNQTTSVTPSATKTLRSDPIKGGTIRAATITRVITADMMKIRYTNGTTDTIQLIGVSTPKTTAQRGDLGAFDLPDTQQGRDWHNKWSKEATSFAREELAGKKAHIVIDPESVKREGIDHLPAYVYHKSGTNFNCELVKRGYGRHDGTLPYTLQNSFATHEANAKAQNRGVWAFKDSKPMPEQSETTMPAKPKPTTVPSLPPTRAEPSSPTTESAPTTTTVEPPSSTTEPAPTTTATETPSPTTLKDDYNCNDFDTQQEAQEFFEAHNPEIDPYGLDNDDDGTACETVLN